MATVDVPSKWDVSINGRPYKLNVGQDYQRGSPTSQRATMDTSARASGGSIATGIAWRRSQQNWAGGAGQRYFDEDSPTSTSDESRFHRSVNVDPWTRRQLGLLRASATLAADGFSFIGSKFAALPDVGTYGTLYVTTTTSGDHLRQYVLNGASAPTPTACTGSYGASYDIATNGSVVYAACVNGLYSIAGTVATALASAAATTHSFVSVCNGRLLASKISTPGVLYEYDTVGATVKTFAGAPAATVWQDATGAPKAILVAGNVGRTSTIYRITYDEASGGLNVALTPATSFPEGEIIYSLLFHMGWLVIGSSKGVRIGTVDESGNVTYGPVITDPGPVRGLSAEDRYVWFTWSMPTILDDWSPFDHSAFSSGESPLGAGRLDLGDFVLPLQPAYATDVVETTGIIGNDGYVTDVCRINGRTWFVPNSYQRIFYEANTAIAPAGWIESSLIEFGFEGSKIAADVEVRHTDASGTIAVTLITEDGADTQLGTVGLSGQFQSDTPIPAQEITAEAHRLRVDFLSGYQLAVLADSPLSYWPLQETLGSTATDVQALHNGTYTATTLNAAGPGGALPKAPQWQATGTAQIDFGDQPEYEFTGDFTIEGWFRPASSGNSLSTSGTTFSKGAFGTSNEYSMMVSSDHVIAAIYQSGSGSSYLYTNVTYGGSPNTWHHVVMVCSGTTIAVYIDTVGAPDLSPPVGIRQPPGTAHLKIESGFSVDRVAGLAVYDHALTSESIRAHYLALTPTTNTAAVRRWALRAVPVARTYEVITWPLVLAEQVDANGAQVPLDTRAEYLYLLALKQSREVVTFNELGYEVQGVIDEITFGNVTEINQKDGQPAHFNGELLIKIWTV